MRACRLFRDERGLGSFLTILGAALASAIIVFPLARWQMSLSNNAANVTDSLDNAGVKLEMMSALEDRWRQINDMNLDAFKAATDKTTKYGKYTVSESYGTLGVYNESTGNCDSGTPSDDDKACRVATLTVTGPDGVLPLGPVTATRVASAKTSSGVGYYSGKNERRIAYDEFPFTIPKDGYIKIWLHHYDAQYVRSCVTKNDIMVFSSAGQYGACDMVLIAVQKGDVINYKGWTNEKYWYDYEMVASNGYTPRYDGIYYSEL